VCLLFSLCIFDISCVVLLFCYDDNFRSASCWVSLSCDRGECVIFADGEVVYVAWYCVRLFFFVFF
jgi:hypothetical protein